MLVHARRSRQLLPHLPAAIRPTTLDQAYSVQWEGWAATLAEYETRRIGHKVAATSAMAQASVNMTHPFAGALFSHSTLGYSEQPRGHVAAAGSDGGASSSAMGEHRTWRLSAGAFGDFRLIEPEFGLVLRSSIEPGTEHTADTVVSAVGGIVPCIELVTSGFDLGSADDTAAQLAGFRSLGALSLIADNASHGAWVVGSCIRDGRWAQAGVARGDDNDLEFDRLLAGLDGQRCELFLNDKLVADGDGSAVLGHPLNSLAWLANHLGSYGMSLAAGEVVTTGVVVNGLVNAREGDVVRADFGSLGTVEILFEP
jgi:2-keto-4-pentenoate hydratase